MKSIGLDFGTTNSTICFFDENKNLRGFEPIAGRGMYLPTIAAYKHNAKPLVGFSAADELTSKNYDIYVNAKIHLTTNNIPNKTKHASQVMKDYIQGILDAYKQGRGMINEKLDKVVMTIPYAWLYNERNQTILERIEKEVSDISDATVRLYSEPTAAAIYFCHEYKIKEKKDYKGYIFVVDYGGGTLDVTLCEAMGGQVINIIDGEGFSTSEHGNAGGYAGVAFDNAVIMGLLNNKEYDLQHIQPDPDSINFIKLRKEFENKKINQSEVVTECMLAYSQTDGDMNSEVFTLGVDKNDKEIIISCKDLDNAFKNTCNTKLVEVLESVKRRSGKISENRDNFKIQLVGGFCNFVCVETAVKKVFNCTDLDHDSRFIMPYPPTERAYAISKGAALIANGWGVVDTCRHSYGYVSYVKGEGDSFDERRINIINQGCTLTDVEEPVFSDEWVRVKNMHGKVAVYGGDISKPNNMGLVSVTLDEPTRELFPNLDGRAKLCQIGFSVNHYQVPYLHTKDKNGDEIGPIPLRKLKNAIDAVNK